MISAATPATADLTEAAGRAERVAGTAGPDRTPSPGTPRVHRTGRHRPGRPCTPLFGEAIMQLTSFAFARAADLEARAATTADVRQAHAAWSRTVLRVDLGLTSMSRAAYEIAVRNRDDLALMLAARGARTHLATPEPEAPVIRVHVPADRVHLTMPEAS